MLVHSSKDPGLRDPLASVRPSGHRGENTFKNDPMANGRAPERVHGFRARASSSLARQEAAAVVRSAVGSEEFHAS